MTQAGLIIGTPQYISPEQAQGKNIGTYSDIYSLGIVFYEMLTGKVPYAAESPIALVMKHISEPVPELTGNHAVYQPLLDRMMAKTREQRYSNCDQIIADIDSIEAGKPVALATEILNPAVNIGNATANSLSTVSDFPKIEAGEPAAQATEILATAAVVAGGRSAVQPTEILSTATGAARGKPAVRPAKPSGQPAAHKGKANTLKLVEKQETRTAGRAKTGGRQLKSILWIALASLIAGSVYLFVDIDTGKLKTLVGVDPGPVYSRVGRLVSIPGGSFAMGNAAGDSNENPVHTVYLEGFRLGETEVTQRQWRQVMGNAPSYFRGCRPALQVTQ